MVHHGFILEHSDQQVLAGGIPEKKYCRAVPQLGLCSATVPHSSPNACYSHGPALSHNRTNYVGPPVVLSHMLR